MLYTRLYSVHPYWWKRQVLHQTWPSGSQHASKKECRQDIHSGFETHEEGHTKSKTGAIRCSTKWTLVQTKIFKKKKKKKNFDLFEPRGGGEQKASSNCMATRPHTLRRLKFSEAILCNAKAIDCLRARGLTPTLTSHLVKLFHWLIF